MASLESLEQTLGRFRRSEFKVVEHQPARDLVAAQDIVRTDDLGRTYVACPKGQPPPSWLALTEEERDNLVEAQPSPATGHMHTTGYGFAPEGVVVGEYESDE